MEVRPESLHGDDVISLFGVNKGRVQPGRVVGLDGVGSVL